MTLEPGTHLGPYEIVDRLGAGGMGEVWRARDTRLGRDVAIKVLPAAFAADPQLQARLVREARAVSQLEHPHICRLYDVGIDGQEVLNTGSSRSAGTQLPTAGAAPASSIQYLVMEYLEGETLAQRLRRGPLPTHEIFRFGQQIAGALNAAHRKGLVHRDLKPGNIMLTRSGAKLLDFGLAKSQGSPLGAWDGDSVTVARQATTDGPITALGVIVGTLQYMAPEQLDSRESDSRTDIFALGAVLHEMATGRAAFRANSQATLIGAILTSQPEPISLADPAAPPGLDRVVRKCLEKHPDDRWQSAQDVAGQLQWIGELSSGTGPAPVVTDRRGWRRFSVPLLVALALGIGSISGWMVKRPAAPAAAEGSVVRSQIALPPGIRLAGWGTPSIAISPNGKHVAFVGHDGTMQRLYIRRLDQAEAVAVPGSESAEGPFFSPDGRFVGFAVAVSGFNVDLPPELRRVSVDGGLPQTICPLRDYFGGTWSSDGTIYYVGGAGEGISKVPSSGGEPTRMAAALDAGFPLAAPDGRTVFASAITERSALQLVAVDTASGAVRELGIEGTAIAYLPNGRLLYATADRRLMAVPFDLASRTTSGRGATLLDDLAMAGVQEPVVAVSNDGTLIYVRGFVSGSNRELTRLTRVSRAGRVVPLPFDADTYSRRGISVSPDASRVAATTWEGRLWVCDLRRGTRLPLPQTAGTTRVMPLWAPDGRSIVFNASGAGLDSMHMFVQAADGTSPARQLTAGFPKPFEAWPTSWAAPDVLVFNHFREPTAGVSTLAVGAENASPTPLLVQPGTWHMHGRVSPDRRWIAYQARERDRQSLLVRHLGLRSGPVPIASAGADPRWSSDGREIYFRLGDTIMVADFQASGNEPHPGTPRLLFELAGLKAYDTIPGTRDFIAVVEEPASGVQTTISMVQQWFRELETAVEGGR